MAGENGSALSQLSIRYDAHERRCAGGMMHCTIFVDCRRSARRACEDRDIRRVAVSRWTGDARKRGRRGGPSTPGPLPLNASTGALLTTSRTLTTIQSLMYAKSARQWRRILSSHRLLLLVGTEHARHQPRLVAQPLLPKIH
jgi:hypothetical protein